MSIGEFCNREVVFGRRGDSVTDVARLMREHHVGDLVIVDEIEDRRTPIGIVTDRDIVIEVIAEGVSPNDLVVEDLMSTPVATVGEDCGVYEALQAMRRHGVRRLPVVGRSGDLLGIVTLDDLLELFAEELSSLAKVIQNEQRREREVRVSHASV